MTNHLRRLHPIDKHEQVDVTRCLPTRHDTNIHNEYEDKGVAGYSAIVTLDPLLRVGDARRPNGLSSLSAV